MAKRFDPKRLFGESRVIRREPELHIHAGDEAELDAIRAGTKKMAYYSAGVDELARYVDLATRRDLLVVAQPHAEIESESALDIFILEPDELWRVPAYLALWETAFVDGRWSDAAENLVSYLLGYTPQQRRIWIERARQARPAWTCATVYALLTDEQRRVVDSVGRRCFGPATSLTGITLFRELGALDRNALARVPKHLTLARAGLRHEAFRRLFARPGGARRDARRAFVASRQLTPKDASALHAGMVSNVQFLTKTGWK